MNGNSPKLRHVQTLVEMNHCVGTARRDAAFDNLLDNKPIRGQQNSEFWRSRIMS